MWRRVSRLVSIWATTIVVLGLLLQLPVFGPATGDGPIAQSAALRTDRVITCDSAVVDYEIAAFFPLPWQYSSLALGRSLLAVHAPQSEVAFESGITSLERSEPSQVVRWKHRRCLCQILDTPPPADIGLQYSGT